jgi:hypothetical protein
MSVALMAVDIKTDLKTFIIGSSVERRQNFRGPAVSISGQKKMDAARSSVLVPS